MGAQGIEGWIVPTEVRPRRAGGECDVHAVIDQDGNGQGVNSRISAGVPSFQRT